MMFEERMAGGQTFSGRRGSGGGLRIGLAALALLGIAAMATGAWMWQRRSATAGGAGGAGGKPARPVVLVVSGDTQGWITPCGCTANQSGGLARRASYLAGLRSTQDVLYADAGGAADGITDFHAAKLEAIARGEVLMQIAAHNLGRSELELGAPRLREIRTATGIPWLGTNTAAIEGEPVAETLRIATVGKQRIALLGVIAGQTSAPGFRVSPPREAILSAMAAHRGEFDRAIVLAYMGDEELEAMARELPEVDAIIGGPTGQPVPPHRIGPTLISSATRKGKFLLQASLSSPDATIVELNERFPDAPAQVENLAAYRRTLKARDFPAALTRLVPDAGRLGRIAAGGSQECRPCHVAEYDSWSSTGHAHAWESLASRGTQVDPSCQVCHTTGYGAPGGFSSIAASPDRVDVGCESCHGPSAAHAANPGVRTPFLASAQCRTCHDDENSPRFDAAAYWSRIRHGTSKEAPQ